MERYPQLQKTHIHELYLDTTYCDPAYDFPPQSDVIKFAVSTAVQAVFDNPKTLIVCGTYSIGKERIFLAIADALDCKICVTRDKQSILMCLEDKHIESLMTLDWNSTKLHVIPMAQITHKKLLAYLDNTKISTTKSLHSNQLVGHIAKAQTCQKSNLLKKDQSQYTVFHTVSTAVFEN
ncbi:DNA cross-link repair 1A protein-like [Saccoglossus kowalevskii]|uniref:DNA cross-link repair 1A protein-like n=1 Tax=Saccoglossus kowalevskii TaxID=10224 RepID=A0ABM0MTI7_SACKO|nr:PREDICTED: DNA cross-link repair 1A protein-like [Saccoglossus kowalevskii]